MRTADCPVSQVPLIDVRHTSLAPGVLKQNFCQSPYLMARASRWPRSANSACGFSLAVALGGLCCPWADTTKTKTVDSSTDAVARVRGCNKLRSRITCLHH